MSGNDDASSSVVRSSKKTNRRWRQSQAMVPHCLCGVERVQRTAWTDLNPGRRFVCCYRRNVSIEIILEVGYSFSGLFVAS